jgi:hypothetical protein
MRHSAPFSAALPYSSCLASYLGVRTLPRLSGWEVDHFFTLEPAECEDICTRFRGVNRLAVALQLSFLRMTGCPLDGVRILPRELLSHVGAQLEIDVPTIASVRALYRRKRTRYDHQQWAMTMLGFTPLTSGRRRVLVTRLKQQARSTGEVDALIEFARRWLFDQQIIIPSKRALKELAARILVEVEHELYLEVIEVVPEPVCAQWLDALYEVQPGYEIQLIDWLKTPPAKRSPSHLKELFDKIEVLQALEVHRHPLPFPLERQRFYASRMRRRSPQRFRSLSPARRTLELTCFLRVTLMDLVDTALSQVEKRISELWSGARQAAERRQTERTQGDWAAVEAIHQTLHDPSIVGTRKLARALFGKIGPIQFPNLLLELDSQTRFSWQLLGRAPTSERNLLALYGALIAQGSELSAARVALMIPGLPVNDIQQAMQLLEEDGALKKANGVVLEFLRRHDIVTHWGNGTFASSDMIALEVSRHLWQARQDPRRRTPVVGSYVHVLDQWGISYDQPIVLNERHRGAW